MMQTHMYTCLHPPAKCNLQQHPHQLQLLQQLLPWQLLREELPSLRPAVRSVQGGLKMRPPVTELSGDSHECISLMACRTDTVQKPSDLCLSLCIFTLYVYAAFRFN